MDLNESRHLCHKDIVNLGSFYTPYKYVMLAGEWLESEGVDDSYTILDSSCGYGAFFELSQFFAKNKYVGNDIDKKAIEMLPSAFPFVKLFNKNLLVDVKREQFDIADADKLIIVGNPPYNDMTSIINHKIKNNNIQMDKDLTTRDLGISSILSYNKLHADYVLILHPLSYSIKRANYRLGSRFFSNYSIERHIIFSSQEFANTSKFNGFPIIMALYKRNCGNGIKYSDVQRFNFQTVEGRVFNLSKRDYVANYIQKYPHNIRYSQEILFYTLRDINALNRSRTFIKNRVANAVDVNPDKLGYYCYIDCFKKYASTPYFMGNFDVPFIKEDFDSVMDSVIAISKFNHQDVFGACKRPTADDENKVVNYINKVLTYC
ncbi:SAM-dependent methyltransferase [Candidatus Saccharibacteria bacterium]|nr:SAM-dependent methyltransferase [Candidatus Saccharibacteria bacterium]